MCVYSGQCFFQMCDNNRTICACRWAGWISAKGVLAGLFLRVHVTRFIILNNKYLCSFLAPAIILSYRPLLEHKGKTVGERVDCNAYFIYVISSLACQCPGLSLNRINSCWKIKKRFTIQILCYSIRCWIQNIIENHQNILNKEILQSKTLQF